MCVNNAHYEHRIVAYIQYIWRWAPTRIINIQFETIEIKPNLRQRVRNRKQERTLC